MKKIKWKKHKIFALLSIIFVLFFTRATLLPIQFSSVALVNAIGIDKVADNYLVSMQIITPKFETGVTKNLEVVTSSDASVTKCFKNIFINLGKQLGFAHLSTVIINAQVLQQESLVNLLKPLTNSSTHNKNAALVTTNNLSSEILLSSGQEGNIYDIAQFFIAQNKNALLKEVTNVNANKKTLLLPVVTLEQTTNQFDIQIQGGQLENNESSSNKKLKFNGELLLLKNNLEQVLLSSEDYENLSLFKKAKDITLEVENKEENINILFSKTKIKTSFYNGVPRLHLYVKVEVEKPENYLQNETEFKREVIFKTRQKLADAFLLIKQNNMNLFFIAERFLAFHNDEWQEYLKQVEDENMFEKLEVFAHFIVKLKNQISLAY